MKTLIIHDINGKIIMTSTGGEQYTGVTAITADVPEGYMVEKVENGKPVIVPIPKTEQELKMEQMQEQINAQADAILALMEG